MIKKLTKWAFRLMVTGLFLLGLLIVFMLNPPILYANKTVIGNCSIYHNQPLDPNFQIRLEQANAIIKSSELYDPNLKIDICLKDGSKYPALIEHVLGKDILSSFYNKIICTGDVMNYNDNYIQLGEHRWNLVQMFAHAETHCLEFNRYGLWRSNPIGGHPGWKWEGYPEYIARQKSGVENLQHDIQNLLKEEQAGNNYWMTLPDSTETLIFYYKYRLLIQYCMDVKKMSFVQVLKDTTGEEIVNNQMMAWYNEQGK